MRRYRAERLGGFHEIKEADRSLSKLTDLLKKRIFDKWLIGGKTMGQTAVVYKARNT
jgi:hypothetical protein